MTHAMSCNKYGLVLGAAKSHGLWEETEIKIIVLRAFKLVSWPVFPDL